MIEKQKRLTMRLDTKLSTILSVIEDHSEYTLISQTPYGYEEGSNTPTIIAIVYQYEHSSVGTLVVQEIWNTNKKSRKPLSRESFNLKRHTEDHIFDYFKKAFLSCCKWADRQLKHKEEKKAYKTKQREETQQKINGYEVGDFFYTSWGYEQTNVEFYMIVDRISNRKFKVVQVCSETVPGSEGMDYDRVKPTTKHYGKPFDKMVNSAGNFKMSECQTARPYTYGDKGTHRSWGY